jgi:hypothetical protein
MFLVDRAEASECLDVAEPTAEVPTSSWEYVVAGRRVLMAVRDEENESTTYTSASE